MDTSSLSSAHVWLLIIAKHRRVSDCNDMDATAKILPTVPKDQLNKVAQFLESQGDPPFSISDFLTLT